MAFRSLSTGCLLATAALLVPSGPARAQSCEAPPGSSAVDQYCEAIPGAAGNESTRSRQAGGSSSATSGASAVPVPSETASSLRERGADGAAVLDLAGGSTSDGSASGTGSSSGGGSGSSAGPNGAANNGPGADVSASDTPSGNPLKAVSAAVQSGDTVGAGFVWVLLGVAAAVAGIGWVGTRRRVSA